MAPAMLAVALVAAASPAAALPQNGTVVGGQASIQQTAPGRLDVTQASLRAAIDWHSFGIAAGEHTHFQQPAGGIALNRVTGGNVSEIVGRLSATGQVWLVNPNGVLFGKGAQVDVGGLVASTAGMSAGSFMAGSNRFDQPGRADAAIVNHGRLTAAKGGMVALVGPRVENHGLIEARLGKVALAGGNRFTLDLDGDQLVNLAISDALAAAVVNSGQILADGGRVALSVKSRPTVTPSEKPHNVLHSLGNS